MHLITIAIGRGTPVIWSLLFKTDEALEKAKALLEDQGDLIVADDYGQEIRTARANISAIMIENMNESREAHIARTLHEMKLRATMQQRVQNDPVLKVAMMTGGPAMLNPVGLNGGMPRN